MDIIIKDMDLNEIDMAYSLTKKVFNEAYNLDEIKDLFNRIHEDKKSYRFLVAKDGDKVIGFTSCSMSYNLFDGNRPFMTLWWVCVDDDYRRLGVATKLLNKAEDIAKENNCELICFISEDFREGAHKFYIKNGYKMNSKGFMKVLD